MQIRCLSNIIHSVTLGNNVSQSVSENDRHHHPDIATITPAHTPAPAAPRFGQPDSPRHQPGHTQFGFDERLEVSRQGRSLRLSVSLGP